VDAFVPTAVARQVMIDFVTKSVNSRMITAFFDTRTAAESASDSLQALGVRASHIAIAEGADPAGTSHTHETDTHETGFWESLKSMFLPAEDHHSYAEGLRRGGFLLSADVDPELYDRALEVVDAGGAVNMDEREASWASSGWTRYEAGETNPPPRTPPAVPAPRDTPPTFDEGAVFATRDTSHGRTGLRSYMYAIPEKEQADQRFVSETGRIEDHMDVIASDGIKIGTVDHLDGENIKLAKTTSPDGMHHLVSLADVDHVDTHVHLNRTSPEVRASW
jgi:hypothetical protein